MAIGSSRHRRLRADGVERILSAGIEEGALDVQTKVVARLMANSVRQMVEPDFVLAVGIPVRDVLAEWYGILEYGLKPRSERGPQAPE